MRAPQALALAEKIRAYWSAFGLDPGVRIVRESQVDGTTHAGSSENYTVRSLMLDGLPHGVTPGTLRALSERYEGVHFA